MSSLFFRSLFVLSLVTTLTTPLFAQESVEEVDASPVVFTNDTLSVLEGNTAFVRLTADDIQETTRVRVRITPDTARSGTDYRNPGIVTVTFYKNGVNNKRIGVRTINRSGVQGERSFTASIISINGKAVPADTGEMMEVTITDRGSRTTTTGTTSSQEQVRGNGGTSTVPQPVVTPAPTSTNPSKPPLVVDDCTNVQLPVGYQRGTIEKISPSWRPFAYWGTSNQVRSLLPVGKINVAEYNDFPELLRRSELLPNGFKSEARRVAGGAMMIWTSGEILSSAERSQVWCDRLALAPELCFNGPAGHPNSGLVKDFEVSFSHCPYKMDTPQCNFSFSKGNLLMYAGQATLKSYQLMDKYNPETDECVFDMNRPIYMNVKSRCVEEDGVTPVACKWLHAWSGI